MSHMRGGTYELTVGEPLDPSWSDWFGGCTIVASGERGSKIIGRVTDQAALHGLLSKIRDLNLTLISVARIADVAEAGRSDVERRRRER